MVAKLARDEPIIEFLRFHIRAKNREKRLTDIARSAGCAQSRLSQILAGNTSVTLETATALATKAFGYSDFPAFAAMAYTWAYSGKPDELPSPESFSQREQAIATAREYHVSTDQLDRAFKRFAIDDYEQQDASWWLQRFLEEKARDDERAGKEKAAKRKTESDKRHDASVIRQSYDEAGRIKKESAKKRAIGTSAARVLKKRHV